MFKFVIIVALAAGALAAPALDQEKQPSLLEQAYDAYSSCSAEGDVATCLKVKALGDVDRVARSAQIDVVDGLKIVQNEEGLKNSRNARSFNDVESALPTEPRARELAVDEALFDKAASFLSTHTVELSMPEEVSRSLDEARGRKKKNLLKTALPVLLLLKLKTLLPLAIGGLALLAFKALVIGKIALILSVVLALQKFLGGSKAQSYDVISHDAGHHHDDHHGSQWGRSLELAYSAHKPATE